MSENITLVRAGHVLTMGPQGDITGGAVAVSGDRIADVGTYASLIGKYPGAQVVGDEYGIVIPGLVNAHTHMSEALIPGMAENLSIWVWGARLIMPVMPHLTREMARVGTLFRGAELIRSGVTTFNDMFCHSHPTEFASLGVVDGLEELGLRGVVAFGAEDIAWGTVPALSVSRVSRGAPRPCRALRSFLSRLFPRGSRNNPWANRCVASRFQRTRAVNRGGSSYAPRGGARRKNRGAAAVGKKHGRACR